MIVLGWLLHERTLSAQLEDHNTIEEEALSSYPRTRGVTCSSRDSSGVLSGQVADDEKCEDER